MKRSFGLGSVSKALTSSFRRAKKKDSDSESMMGDFQSQLTLNRTDSMMSIKGPATPGVSRFKNPLKRTPSFKNEEGVEKESLGSKKETPVLPKKDSLLKRQMSNISIMSKNRSHVDPDDAKHKAGTSEEKEITLHIKQSGSGTNNENSDNSNIDKMVPLTKSNVVSMTTAAITAQPVQISTSVTKQLGNREPSSEELKRPTSAAISKRDSQKTIENLSRSESRQSNKAETPKPEKKFPSRPPSSKQSSTPKTIEILKPTSKPPTPGSQRHVMEPTASTRPSSNNNNDNTKSNMMAGGGGGTAASMMMEQISEKSITTVHPDAELESGNYQQKMEHEMQGRGVDEKTLKSSKSESTLIANDGEGDDDNNNNDEDGIIDYDEDEDGDIGDPDG